ncbi:uncharacterized protein BcabD6B2_14810 [Babesia caballi]|uniref:Transmembrane protein, putative n=1 Tax=Babesia caballi TaxID=5871 RepID=A0AAV4LQC0_BABCB|nr:transmembrane protein, putative [Babesia caballi]
MVEGGSHRENPSTAGSSPDPARLRSPQAAGKRLRFMRAPSVLHSAMYGAVAGTVVYGAYFIWRAFKLDNCNTEYFSRQSRWRHFEKQQLYQRELSQKMNAHFVGSLAQEYDPVALRKPDSSL